MSYTPQEELSPGDEKLNLLYASPEEYFEKYPAEGSDREVMMVASRLFGYRALRFASADLLDDKDLIRNALLNDNNAFACASVRLRDDVDFAKEMVEHDLTNLYYVSDRLQENGEFLLKMMELYPTGRASAFSYTPNFAAVDCFSDGLKEKIGSLDPREYFRRQELFEKLHRVVPTKPPAKAVKRKI
ncbi:hypothetical protein ABIB38_001776 [Massilia sp. UYP11]|uniref:DUF4116 domain-containing protein n=1 Tax=Massilia sp. UYP11 TaxID=1756385 RepID=UPI003D221963